MKTTKILMLLIASIILSACSDDNDNNLNNVPVILDITLDLSNFHPDLGDLVTTVVASDIDGDNLTFSIVELTPSASISINSENGEVNVNNLDAFDYDLNQRIISTVLVSDGRGGETSAQLVLNIIDPNA